MMKRIFMIFAPVLIIKKVEGARRKLLLF